MKKGITAILILVCLLLGAATVVLRLTDDSTPPEIHFQENQVTYTEGGAYDALLEGVTATDNRDGDVTDTLVVERVYPDETSGQATVVYAARDEHNNIAKASRIVNYSADGSGAAAADEESTEEDAGTDDTAASAGETTASSEETAPTPSATPEADQESADGSPRITLTEESITINQGESVDRLSYVADIQDDTDDTDELWRNIQIAGDELDRNTPGTYELIYYVVDSDGNQSNEAVLTITVQ